MRMSVRLWGPPPPPPLVRFLFLPILCVCVCDQADMAQSSDSTLAAKGSLKEISALEAQLKRQIDMVSDRMMSLSSQYGTLYCVISCFPFAGACLAVFIAAIFHPKTLGLRSGMSVAGLSRWAGISVTYFIITPTPTRSVLVFLCCS